MSSVSAVPSGRYRMGKTALAKAITSIISFDDDDLILVARRFLSVIEIVERAALMKERRFRRIEVFRLHRPARGRRKAMTRPFGIHDRKHDPAAEAVVDTARFVTSSPACRI